MLLVKTGSILNSKLICRVDHFAEDRGGRAQAGYLLTTSDKELDFYMKKEQEVYYDLIATNMYWKQSKRRKTIA